MDCKQSPSEDAAQPDPNLVAGDPNSPDFDLQATDLQDSDLQDSDLQDSDLQDSGLQDSGLQDSGLEDSGLEGDTLREECGVFGIFGHPEAAAITALGLHALQHRCHEAAGIVSFDGSRFHSERRLGLVGDTFSRPEVIDRLPRHAAIGHVRYSTTGATILRNWQ